MTFDSNISACAGMVHKADPDRFMAAMAAPVAARPVLFVLYAFNIEVARAPWVTNEPAIASIRLQWWRDALDEIASAGVVRRHEVVTPLAQVLGPDQARQLDELIVARYWDINNDPFEDTAEMSRYIDQTSGHLIWVAAQNLGPADEDVVRDFAYAVGLAGFLRAVPELRARAKVPLPDGSGEAIRDLAQTGLARLRRAREKRAKISGVAAAALISGWQAEKILKQVVQNPTRVDQGTLGQGEISRRLSLMQRVITGRW